MTGLSSRWTAEIWEELGATSDALSRVSFVETGEIGAVLPVCDLAAAAVAVAGLAIGELTPKPRAVRVDRRLSAFWFDHSVRPIGWRLPDAWNPLTGDYQSADGWIRLHANAPHHRAVIETVLGKGDRDQLARQVIKHSKTTLETTIVDAGGCAAAMRSIAQWRTHPQGSTLEHARLAQIERSPCDRPSLETLDLARPLTGIKVLDLTRVVSGPVATRFLAGLGADVLRIDPPEWNEPGLEAEFQLGKRSARLDLRAGEGRRAFLELLAAADVFVHSLRPGALDRLGIDAEYRRHLAPGLIDVSLNAYGWEGPWCGRRGYDSLVQMASGIADAGMRWTGCDRPKPLPFQALDHATGYFMAAAAILGVAWRAQHGFALQARFSLASTARLLIGAAKAPDGIAIRPESSADRSASVEVTDWGPAQRIKPPVQVEGIPLHWARPARKLGFDTARWR